MKILGRLKARCKPGPFGHNLPHPGQGRDRSCPTCSW